MTTPPSPRRLLRELVLQALYACDCEATPPDQAFTQVTEGSHLSERNLRFARQLFDLTRRHADWADQQIADLSENWDIRRIAAIDHTILRMALVELEHVSETPVKVVLNEAIELARKFSTAQSSGFVNGILDAYINRAEKKETT